MEHRFRRMLAFWLACMLVLGAVGAAGAEGAVSAELLHTGEAAGTDSIKLMMDADSGNAALLLCFPASNRDIDLDFYLTEQALIVSSQALLGGAYSIPLGNDTPAALASDHLADILARSFGIRASTLEPGILLELGGALAAYGKAVFSQLATTATLSVKFLTLETEAGQRRAMRTSAVLPPEVMQAALQAAFDQMQEDAALQESLVSALDAIPKRMLTGQLQGKSGAELADLLLTQLQEAVESLCDQIAASGIQLELDYITDRKTKEPLGAAARLIKNGEVYGISATFIDTAYQLELIFGEDHLTTALNLREPESRNPGLTWYLTQGEDTLARVDFDWDRDAGQYVIVLENDAQEITTASGTVIEETDELTFTLDAVNAEPLADDLRLVLRSSESIDLPEHQSISALPSAQLTALFYRIFGKLNPPKN